jgi:3-deoxy-7-phosphoheptulonate synthase
MKKVSACGKLPSRRAMRPRPVAAAAELEGHPRLRRILETKSPFPLASRALWEGTNPVRIAEGLALGDGGAVVMAGPCSVEGREQILESARAVRSAGAAVLRGGAFKPRSNPYSFQGLGNEGLRLLDEARRETGLPVVTEVMEAEQVGLMLPYVDIFQVGARNMQNFTLLKELGKSDKPVLLKRGLSATVDEWLQAAEYILAGGNFKVLLCERGIRTFETRTRNTLDLSAVPTVRSLSHLPVVVDPSHGTGHRHMVEPMALAALAAGADGLILEVHPRPEEALSDGHQSLRPEEFASLMAKAEALLAALGRSLTRPGSTAPAVAASAGRDRKPGEPLEVLARGDGAGQ